MTKMDLAQERQRLEKLYAAMPDEELDKLLEAANDLSETARALLKSEIERRGGHVESVLEPSPPASSVFWRTKIPCVWIGSGRT